MKDDKMKIDIKDWRNGNVIFSHECKNNTIKLTLELSIKSKANLNGANLSGANLIDANLSGANLIDANLSGANLIDANLSGANLSKANLSGANLNGANLSGANLRWCIGEMNFICSLQLEKWNIVFTPSILAIGCQQHTIEEWKNFNDDKVIVMGSSSLEWWSKWKDFIFMAIDLKFNNK
jgi:hypothetical protein